MFVAQKSLFYRSHYLNYHFDIFYKQILLKLQVLKKFVGQKSAFKDRFFEYHFDIFYEQFLLKLSNITSKKLYYKNKRAEQIKKKEKENVR